MTHLSKLFYPWIETCAKPYVRAVLSQDGLLYVYTEYQHSLAAITDICYLDDNGGSIEKPILSGHAQLQALSLEKEFFDTIDQMTALMGEEIQKASQRYTARADIVYRFLNRNGFLFDIRFRCGLKNRLYADLEHDTDLDCALEDFIQDNF